MLPLAALPLLGLALAADAVVPRAALPVADAVVPQAAGAPAAASALVPGERLQWAITWMGVPAGSAWSTTAGAGPGAAATASEEGSVASAAAWVFEAGARSAGWLASLYPIDDLVRSEWTASLGSTRYVTRFREGRFEQDQDMRLGAEGVVVARSQRFDEEWRTSEDRYAGVPATEDPVSAFYRLRDEAGPVGERVHYRVWTGRKAVPVVVWTAAAEPYQGQPALRVEVLAEHGTEDVEPKMTVWITDDAARVPLAALVHTRAGPVKAALVSRSLH